jgi:hypothetical protein
MWAQVKSVSAHERERELYTPRLNFHHRRIWFEDCHRAKIFDKSPVDWLLILTFDPDYTLLDWMKWHNQLLLNIFSN